MAFYDPMILEIHVLLVDPNADSLVETSTLLQLNLYKVTAVQEPSVASSMLHKGKTKFDVVMVDLSSPELQRYKVVNDAINLGLPAVVMSNTANAGLVKGTIEDGASLFMEKPIVAGELKYLWQHVLREKTMRDEKTVKSKETWKCIGESRDIQRKHKSTYLPDNNTTANIITEVGDASNNKSKKGRLGAMANRDSGDNSLDRRVRRRRSMFTEWTEELHDKFMAAVTELGDGGCFPKDILDRMNVPGLTRMQVASHLQKCRYGWRIPNARGPRQCPRRRSKTPKTLQRSVSSVSTATSSSVSRPKKYGSFPSSIKSCRLQLTIQENQNGEQINPTYNMELVLPPENIVGQEGTSQTGSSSSNNMNETNSSENALIPSFDASFGLASADTSDQNLNDFDFEDLIDFDDQVIVDGQASEAAAANNQADSGLWSYLMEYFGSDDLDDLDDLD